MGTESHWSLVDTEETPIFTGYHSGRIRSTNSWNIVYRACGRHDPSMPDCYGGLGDLLAEWDRMSGDFGE